MLNLLPALEFDRLWYVIVFIQNYEHSRENNMGIPAALLLMMSCSGLFITLHPRHLADFSSE